MWSFPIEASNVTKRPRRAIADRVAHEDVRVARRVCLTRKMLLFREQP